METTPSPPESNVPHPQDPPPFTYPPATETIPEKDVRLWSTLCHLAALFGLVVPTLGSVVGPLVVWLIKRNDHPTIDAHGKEALNFQLSVLIYCWVLGIIGVATLWILVGFAFLALSFLIGLAALILAIVAAVKASNGESFRYPFSIRFFT